MKLKLRIFALMAMLLCFAFQANAQEIVRQSADYITLSNEEDGVAAVVEKFMNE